MKTIQRPLSILILMLCACAIPGEAPPPAPAPVESKKFIASRNLEPFHLRTCQWGKMIKDNLQEFATREEAIAAKHRPCKVCKP